MIGVEVSKCLSLKCEKLKVRINLDFQIAGGSSCWWRLPMDQLLPRHVLDASGFTDKTDADFVRGDDILDIWFDSGSTWKTVVEAATG